MNRIKKVVITALAVCILFAPFKSLAATNCLNVRDYGRHYYTDRRYESVIAKGPLKYDDIIGSWYRDVTYSRVDVCMCGASQTDMVTRKVYESLY